MPGRASSAAPISLGCRFQNTIEARFRSQVDPLVSQSRHDLARRQRRIGRTVTHGQDSLALTFSEFVARQLSNRRARIGPHGVFLSPALHSTQRQPHLRTRRLSTRAGLHGFIEPPHQLLPLWEQGQLTSSSLPQRAFNFFRNTNNAATSANAFSLWCSSRSNSRIRFLPTRSSSRSLPRCSCALR